MANQPANSTIKVYRTLRGQRNLSRYESLKTISGNLRGMFVQVPGEETPATDYTYDTTRKGVTPYDRAGLPVVVSARAVKSWTTAAAFTGVDIAVRIGPDQFLRNTATGLADAEDSDLFKVAQDAL